MILALVMAALCLGEVCWGLVYTASQVWYSTDIMLCAYAQQIPMVALGVFWSLRAVCFAAAPGRER